MVECSTLLASRGARRSRFATIMPSLFRILLLERRATGNEDEPVMSNYRKPRPSHHASAGVSRGTALAGGREGSFWNGRSLSAGAPCQWHVLCPSACICPWLVTDSTYGAT